MDLHGLFGTELNTGVMNPDDIWGDIGCFPSVDYKFMELIFQEFFRKLFISQQDRL
jgi:hypothetical protein